MAGNVDVGIYNAGFHLIVSSGAVAQAGVNVIQVLDIADTWIGPGLFYMAVSLSNNGGRLFMANVSIYARRQGAVQMAAANPLPAVFVPAVPAFTYTPVFGLSSRVVV